MSDGQKIQVPVEYDLEGYEAVAGHITANGEVRLAPEVLKLIFSCRQLQLQAEDGQIFNLRFSHRQLPPNGGIAHVDLIGGLSGITAWDL